MINTLSSDAVVVKSFNNNILMVKANGKEKILFHKGIGFGKKFGEIIPKGTNIEKVFIINNEENQKNFEEVLNRVDDEFVGACEEVIAYISNELGEELNENIHIGLIDHLHFAVKRIKSKQEIQNPFLVEIETLYPKEYDLALMAAKKIGDFADVYISEGEAGFIALHIHSARNSGKLSNTIKYSYLSSSIIEYVEDELDIEIDRKSLDYARFLTHIRFAIERIISNNILRNDLIEVIKKAYPKSYEIAIEVSKILSKGLGKEVNEDEIGYLAVHIERFRSCLIN